MTTVRIFYGWMPGHMRDTVRCYEALHGRGWSRWTGESWFEIDQRSAADAGWHLADQISVYEETQSAYRRHT